MARIPGVNKWWVDKLTAQGISKEEADIIARWTEVDDCAKNLYDIVYTLRSGVVGGGLDDALTKVRENKEREKRAAENEYTLKKTKLSGKAAKKSKDKPSDDDSGKVKELEEAYKKKVVDIEERFAKELAAVQQSWAGLIGEVDFWPAVKAYIRCLVPDAEVDPYHFYNICPVCNFRSTASYRTSKDAVARPEYNQVCSNCGFIYGAALVCMCPLCNSGNSSPLRSGRPLAPLFELLPRVYGVYEDVDHYPPYSEPGKKKDVVDSHQPEEDMMEVVPSFMRGLPSPAAPPTMSWEQNYKQFTDPEYRYHMVCPICLFEWYVVFWFPPSFTETPHLCICGSPMKTVKGKQEEGIPDGAVFYECSNPNCREGRLKNWG